MQMLNNFPLIIKDNFQQKKIIKSENIVFDEYKKSDDKYITSEFELKNFETIFFFSIRI